MENNKIKSKVDINAKITVILDEQEARALQAISVYGYDSFLKMFYQHLGTTYLQPHEQGLKSLFSNVSYALSTHLKNIDNARKELNNGK